MKRLTWSCAVILSACGVSACSEREVVDDPAGTDTGNPYDDQDDSNGGPVLGEGTAGGACDEVVTDFELDADTPLGFSAQSVLTFAGGEHTEPLAWLDSSVAYGPESGRSEITLSVQPLAAHFVDRSPKTASGSGALIGGTPLDGCRDSLRIDVRIGVSTAGGALAETLDTVVEAYAADFASAGFSLDLAALAGTFEADPEPPRNTELTRSSLQLALGFSQYGAVGSLSLFNEFRSLDGNSASASVGGGAALAHFPADRYCGQPNAVSVTAEQAVRGVSMAATLEALNADASVPVRYRSGPSSTLELSFTSDEERVCVSFDRDPLYNGEAGGAVLTFPGRVTLESTDGRIDGSFPVTLSAQTRGDALVFEAREDEGVQDTAQASALPPRFGIQDDIDFSTYGGGSVAFQSVASASGRGGSLAVNGFVIPACLTNPPVVDPSTGSSPGCSGIALVPLWSASWGNAPSP